MAVSKSPGWGGGWQPHYRAVSLCLPGWRTMMHWESAHIHPARRWLGAKALDMWWNSWSQGCTLQQESFETGNPFRRWQASPMHPHGFLVLLTRSRSLSSALQGDGVGGDRPGCFFRCGSRRMEDRLGVCRHSTAARSVDCAPSLLLVLLAAFARAAFLSYLRKWAELTS